MRSSIIVKDGFCDQLDVVRESALASGFGTWKPASSAIGYAEYDGMNFVGRHDLMFEALQAAVPMPIYPGANFFRATKPTTETACVHSDRGHGDWTCIVYMSEHKEPSGTGFYRHRETGLIEMPTVEDMKAAGTLDKFNADMKNTGDDVWEQLDFVRGLYNRALIFHAPLFHARCPRGGFGDGSDQTARMVWVCHFRVKQ
jgi:hypothetical protein